jgi:hypothetical protein
MAKIMLLLGLIAIAVPSIVHAQSSASRSSGAGAGKTLGR